MNYFDGLDLFCYTRIIKYLNLYELYELKGHLLNKQFNECINDSIIEIKKNNVIYNLLLKEYYTSNIIENLPVAFFKYNKYKHLYNNFKQYVFGLFDNYNNHYHPNNNNNHAPNTNIIFLCNCKYKLYILIKLNDNNVMFLSNNNENTIYYTLLEKKVDLREDMIYDGPYSGYLMFNGFCINKNMQVLELLNN